jgi:DNA-directed RNA polymerase sigma subunit (sigma70/sigma32)
MNALRGAAAEVYAGTAMSAADLNGQIKQVLLKEVFDDLEQRACNLLRWRYGLGCAPISVEMLALRMKMTQDEIDEIESEALEQIGFALITRVF